MEALGLADKRNDYFSRLSGGQTRRLSIALALIGQPKIAVLDELTTGLDPQARRDTWELIEGVREQGQAIVLVTHYMEEAERLCDRVALFDSGRVVTAGPERQLPLVPVVDVGGAPVLAAQAPEFHPAAVGPDGGGVILGGTSTTLSALAHPPLKPVARP